MTESWAASRGEQPARQARKSSGSQPGMGGWRELVGLDESAMRSGGCG